MNKKGALFHWIIFGVLAALGLFIILSAEPEAKRIPGEWHLNFLEEHYLKAEADLLRIDQAAKLAGQQTAWELGEKGSFINKSECGSLEGYNLWNNLTEWCFYSSQAKENFLLKVGERLINYSEIKIKKGDLIGKGKKKSIVSGNPLDLPYTKITYVNYTYDTSFRVNLGFDVEGEYEKLQREAEELVAECNEIENLTKCIKEKKKNNWKLKNCEQEGYKETERKVLFCVESGKEVYNDKGKLVPLRYKLALDFTPIKTFVVKGVNVSYDPFNKFFEIIFEEDMSAEGYKIYFTNFTFIEGKAGQPEELEGKVWAGYFWDAKEFKAEEIVTDSAKCASGVKKEENKAYLCGGRIIYTLSDGRLRKEREYLFGVTKVEKGRESEIKELVKYT